MPETRRILLVDDHAGLRHSVALVLAEEGIGACLEAAGCEEALDAAAREPLDLALVDLSPGVDDALELVRELCARKIPVLDRNPASALALTEVGPFVGIYRVQ